jgi:adenosylhomocysteine nucleosidase
MKILITEDDDAKRAEIVRFVENLGVAPADILTAIDMADFMGKFDENIGICVIDLRLPAYDGGGPDLNGIGVLQVVDKKGGGRVKLLAISAYPEEFANIRGQFESRGCLLVNYNQRDVWQSVLKQMIVQAKAEETMDFVIFCALRAERTAYTLLPEIETTPVFKDNVTRLDVAIGSAKGTVVELPRMGLVDAASIVGACIEKYKPKVVAMSGVCAGFIERAELGQLLVSELAYEYQSGKWTDEGFSQEPYQIPISEKLRIVVRELLETPDDLLAKLETGWKGDRPGKMSMPKLAAFTSGSAVIASEKFIAQVANHHRRVSGLDMEIYAVQRAAHTARCAPEALCAKVVVDLADGDKNKRLQPYGSFVSANFIVTALRAYFERYY